MGKTGAQSREDITAGTLGAEQAQTARGLGSFKSPLMAIAKAGAVVGVLAGITSAVAELVEKKQLENVD